MFKLAVVICLIFIGLIIDQGLANITKALMNLDKWKHTK